MATADRVVRVSVVVPAYNEAARLPATLGAVLEHLAAQPYAAEVVVVDDGSTDATSQVATKHAGGPVAVRVVSHPDGANHGKGAAVRLGMLLSRGEFRVFMDADSSTSIDQLGRLLEALEDGADVAVGSRRVAGARIAVAQAWYRSLAGQFGNVLIRVLLLPGMSDTQAGFKGFRAAAAQAVFERGRIDRWAFDVELLVIAQRHGLRVDEVPIHWEDSPQTRLETLDYARFLGDVLRIRFALARGDYDPPVSE